jgi:hypothetical protein
MTPRMIATIGCYLVATVLAVGAITADVNESGWVYLLGAVFVAALGVGLGSEKTS